MKVIVILSFVFLAGCSGYMTLEELEAQAVQTGDWSEVEKRERIIARRKVRTGIACPPGTTGYCVTNFGAESCTCMESSAIRAFLSN